MVFPLVVVHNATVDRLCTILVVDSCSFQLYNYPRPTMSGNPHVRELKALPMKCHAEISSSKFKHIQYWYYCLVRAMLFSPHVLSAFSTSDTCGMRMFFLYWYMLHMVCKWSVNCMHSTSSHHYFPFSRSNLPQCGQALLAIISHVTGCGLLIT